MACSAANIARLCEEFCADKSAAGKTGYRSMKFHCKKKSWVKGDERVRGFRKARGKTRANK